MRSLKRERINGERYFEPLCLSSVRNSARVLGASDDEPTMNPAIAAVRPDSSGYL